MPDAYSRIEPAETLGGCSCFCQTVRPKVIHATECLMNPYAIQLLVGQLKE